jgi:hypothetical protein
MLLGLALATGTLNTKGTNPFITLAPPLPINMSVAVVLNDSVVGGRFIGSKRIEALEVTLNNTGNASTKFRITSYNRKAPNGLDALDMTIAGNWTFVDGTQDTLSCIVIHDEIRGGYGLLQYLSDARSFRVLTPDLFASVSGAQNLPVGDVIARLQPMENCDGVYFNGALLRVVPGGNVTTVTVPNGWAPNSSPESLQYGVAANVLYRFDPRNGTFANLRTFPPSQAYEVRSFQGRIVVAAANSSNGTNGLTQVNQTFFVLNNLPSGLIQVGQFSVSGAFNTPPPLIPFMASPQLTKIGVAVPAPAPSNMSEPNVVLLLQSVDYATSTISALTFKELERFRGTVRNLPPNNKNFFFGDNYYVVRNVSAANGTLILDNTSLVEEAYQFVGGDIIFLRNRILNETRELTDYRRTWVDDSFANQLVVLDAFAVPGGLEVDQFIFGSLGSVNKVVPPTTPPLFSFPIPPQAALYAPEDTLAWVFLSSDSTPGTNFTVITVDPMAPNNTLIVNGSAPGKITILAMSRNCLIFVDTLTQNVTVAAAANGINGAVANGTGLNGTSPQNGPYAFENVTQLLASFTINSSSKWIISERCDRFAVDNHVFFRVQGQPRFSPIRNNISDFTPSSLDRELTAAVVNNSVWLLNTNTSSFMRVFDSPWPILPRGSIVVRDNRIVLMGVNNTAAQVLAFFIESSGSFTNCLNFYFPLYQGPSKIIVSPQLTKVLVVGPFTPPNATQLQPKSDAFTVDYNNRTSLNVPFDFRSFPDPINSRFILDDKYLYVRSLQGANGSNAANGSAPLSPQEAIYFINQDITPQLARSTNLTQQQMASWRRTVLSSVSSDSLTIFVE